jgi:hypothetical protein
MRKVLAPTLFKYIIFPMVHQLSPCRSPKSVATLLVWRVYIIAEELEQTIHILYTQYKLKKRIAL